MRTSNNYRQTATYWAAPVSDGYGGNTFTAPKSLKVRWEEKQEQFTDPEGKINISKAVVWVPSDVTVGGYLMLGSSTQASPDVEHESYRIMQFVKTPNLRNNFNERRAFL
jgi:hypothetical protein